MEAILMANRTEYRRFRLPRRAIALPYSEDAEIPIWQWGIIHEHLKCAKRTQFAKGQIAINFFTSKALTGFGPKWAK